VTKVFKVWSNYPLLPFIFPFKNLQGEFPFKVFIEISSKMDNISPFIFEITFYRFENSKKLSTPEFVRIFGSIPPFLAILTSLLKFTVCEPRPNFLARCFMGQNESALPDNEYGLMVLNNTVSFNVNDCPNPNQIKVQKGLLSFPSGKFELINLC